MSEFCCLLMGATTLKLSFGNVDCLILTFRLGSILGPRTPLLVLKHLHVIIFLGLTTVWAPDHHVYTISSVLARSSHEHDLLYGDCQGKQ